MAGRLFQGLTLRPAEISLLLSVLLLIGRSTGFRSRLYGMSGITGRSAVPVFIPCLLLSRYNLPVRLPVADSPLKSFVSAFLTSLIGFIYNVSAYSFTAAVLPVMKKTGYKNKGFPNQTGSPCFYYAVQSLPR